MVTKKLFALASVSALAGVMTSVAAAGCSSTTTETTTDDDAGDAKAEASRPKSDGGDEPVDECPAKPDQPITADVLDGEIGWKEATAAPGACTTEDIAKFQANSKDDTLATWFDLGNGLGDNCKACIFSKDEDANWQIIVGTAADDGKTGFINFGACFGAQEGAACGKSIQYSEFCGNIVCNECATTATEQQQCGSAAANDPEICGGFADAVTKDCPDIQNSVKACKDVLTSIQTLCGGGSSDAGTD